MLVMDIIQNKTTVAEAIRSFDLPPSEIEEWVDDAMKSMVNVLRSKSLDNKELYERHRLIFSRRTMKRCWNKVREKACVHVLKDSTEQFATNGCHNFTGQA